MEATSASAVAFEALFELLPTPAVLLAPVYDAAHALVDFTFSIVNPTAQHLLGLPARPAGTLCQHLPSPRSAELLDRCRRAFGRAEPTQFTLPAAKGEGFPYAYQFTVQRAGEVLVVHARDLTTSGPEPTPPPVGQRPAHETPPHLLETVFAQAPAGVWVVQGPEYVFELYNSQMGQILGPSPAQALGRPYFEVLPELASQGIPELLRQVWDSGEAVFLEEYAANLLRHAPGQLGYFTFVFQPLRDAQGQVARISCVALDVTAQVVARQRVEHTNQQLDALVRARTQELRAAQAETERQRGELQRILEQAPVAIAIFRGPTHVIELANELHLALWGRTAAQVLGRPLFEALPEAAGRGYEQLLAGVLTTGQPFVTPELSAPLWRHGRLEEVYFSFVYQPLREADGRVSGVVVVASELTEQVRARHQLEQLNQQLEGRVQERTAHVQVLNEQLQVLNGALQVTNEELLASNTHLTRTNTDLDTFVYTASHDLKAPITNIEGLLTALRQELPPEVAQGELVVHLLRLLHDAVARFQQTLGHLTDVTQLQLLGAAPHEEVHLSTLIEHVRLDLAPALLATDGQLHVELGDCAWLRASAKDLRSILYNLLSNALKYRAPDRAPVVQLRVSCAPQRLVLQVQDNGLGLSAEQQQQLFRLFRRLHTHVEGSGVGLYSIKQRIQNAGGTIDVESEPGVGSTFTVALPVS